MKRFTYILIALLFVTLASPVWGAKSFVGFSINNNLDVQIENGLIQNMFNVNKVETDGRYDINLNLAGAGFFTMGGVTFYYKNSAAGTTTFKTYIGYIQPNGYNREIWIPTVPGEQVNVALKEACAEILVNGTSRAFTAGDNILTATGDRIVLKTTEGNKPKIQTIFSLTSGAANTEWLPKKPSCVEAVNIGQALAVGGITDENFLITGYISAKAGNAGDYDTYGNETYWITDDSTSTARSNAAGAFQVFRGVAGTPIAIGDRVRILTKIKNYNGLIQSESKSVVIILPKGSDPDSDPDSFKNKCKIYATSNNCAYGMALGGGAYIMNTQVTLLAIPTPNGVFLRWEDGVTDNPRVVTAGYAGEEERGYDAIFGTTGKGE